MQAAVGAAPLTLDLIHARTVLLRRPRFAIVGMSGVTLSLLNLIDESQTGGWPLWQSLIMTAVGVAGFLFCLIKVIRGVREETPPAPPKQVD